MKRFSQQASPIYSTSDMTEGSIRVLQVSARKLAHTN